MRAIAKKIAARVTEHPSLVHFSQEAQGKVGGFLAQFFTRPMKGIDAKEWIRLLDEIAADPNSGLSQQAQQTLNQLLTEEIPGATSEKIVQAKQIGAELVV